MSPFELSKELGRSENSLMGYAFSLTQNKSDASDLFQETAYRALKHLNQFQPNSNLRAWLMTIMRNIFINAYRKKRRRQVLQDGSDNSFLINSSETALNLGELRLHYEELIKIIENLEDYLRTPFMMVYKGYKYNEIADYLNIPIGTVKSRIFMARQRIKNLIAARYASPVSSVYTKSY